MHAIVYIQMLGYTEFVMAVSVLILNLFFLIVLHKQKILVCVDLFISDLR